MTALQLTAVSARYPARWPRHGPLVLHDIDLAVAAGERVALVGPSGGGKSTLARVAVGLLPPSSGTLHLLGEDTTRWSARRWRDARKRVQLLPQDPSALLVPRVPVRLALEESAMLHGATADAVDRILDAVELTARADAPPEALSGGELRRAGIARILLARPALLLADEPTAGLDLPLASRLLTLLDTLLGDGCALVVITHDPRRVRRLCGRLVVVDGGRIVEELTSATPAPSHATSTRLLRAAGWTGEGV